jgi:glycosyltransferase involved in cell wall biosynthesis
MPGFHVILVVRDEADILPECLARLLEWADSLAVMDTGSTDGTWEFLNDFASRERRLRLHPTRPPRYHNGLRARLFNHGRMSFRRGDWIVRADADELYHIPPPLFVRERVRRLESMVCALQYSSLLTREACEAWRKGEGPLVDARTSIVDRVRHFRIDPFPEQRLYRYRPWMVWPEDMPHPYRPGLCAEARIPVLHYRVRNPAQAARRQALRNVARAAGATGGMHWNATDLIDIDVEANAPGVLEWASGGTLPHAMDRSHLARSAWVTMKERVRNGPVIEDAWDLCTRARARLIGLRSVFPTLVEPGTDRYSFAASAASDVSPSTSAS